MGWLAYWLSTGHGLESNAVFRRNVVEICFPKNHPNEPYRYFPPLGLNYQFNVRGYLPYFLPTISFYGYIHEDQRGQEYYDLIDSVSKRYDKESWSGGPGFSGLDKIGESGPPWGVPSFVGCSRPSIMTPEFKKLRMSFNTRLSVIFAANRAISLSWFTRSKNFAKSMSITYRSPDATYPIVNEYPHLYAPQHPTLHTKSWHVGIRMILLSLCRRR